MGGELVEVELVDDDAPDGRWSAGGSPRARRAERRRWSSRAWARVALPLALVMAAGVGLDGAAAAGIAHPAQGEAGDLRVPRTVHWSAVADGVLGLVGDAVVLSTSLPPTVAVRGLRDGSVRWSRPLSDCALVDASPDAPGAWWFGPSETWAPVDAADARLVCTDTVDRAGTLRVLLDAATGAVLAQFGDAGSLGLLFAAEGVLLVHSGRGAADAEIAAYALRTGERLWAAPVSDNFSMDVRGGALVVGDSVGEASVGPSVVVHTDTDDGASSEVSGDVEQAAPPAVAYDLHTGARVEIPPMRYERPGPTLEDGTRLRTVEENGSQAVVVATAADGTERWRAPGWSVADVVPVAGIELVPVANLDSGVLEMHDAHTGALRWELGFSSTSMGGVGDVLVIGQSPPAGAGADAVLRGLDPASGSELWSQPVDQAAVEGAQYVSDGTRFALVVSDQVEVRDGRNGDVVARWPLPEAGASSDRSTSYTVDGVTVTTIQATAQAGLTLLDDGRLLVVHGDWVGVLGW